MKPETIGISDKGAGISDKGAGDSLNYLEMKNLGFLVSWFLGFLCLFVVSWFLGFKDSWRLGFKVPKIYQMSISCLLEDIDPISKIVKIVLDGSPGCFRRPSFRTSPTNLFPKLGLRNIYIFLDFC